MREVINLIILNLFILSLLNCNTLEPVEDTPGKRDYVWTVDTIETYFRRMWASSPTDIWAVNNGDWDKSISHFDGNSWTFYGVPGLLNLTTIYGFFRNNIFVGADNGSIWKFDGTSWKLFAELKKEGTDYFLFENIWGESPNDFFAVGSGPDDKGYFNSSIITHYTNSKWDMLNTDVLKGDVVRLYKNRPDNKIYFLLIEIGGAEYSDSTIIYEYTTEKYIKLYSSMEVQGLQADISLINNEVYFVLGSEIAKRVDNNFQTILKVDNSNFYQRIWGRNSKDIFLMMVDGIAHYNGSNIEYLFHYNLRTYIAGAVLFKDDVFFSIYESQTGLNLIYHGKLKE